MRINIKYFFLPSRKRTFVLYDVRLKERDERECVIPRAKRNSNWQDYI